MGVEWLKGRTCTRVVGSSPSNLRFEFGDGTLHAEGLWRVIEEGAVVLTSRDHGQWYGLPEPVDANQQASKRLQGQRVRDVALNEASADLVIVFEAGQRLELLTETSGFESWTFTAPGVHLVACCGGGVSDFGTKA
jgi:hypothetical protein